MPQKPFEDLNVPRDRAGEFHTQAFEQYRRYEPQVALWVDPDVCGRNQHA
ncbi:MAG: hypothetical protein NVS9B9_19050 [Ktedonobacteraceae bacterium]